MRILWAANLIPANLSEKLNMKGEVLGGWVESMANRLREYDDIELGIACNSNSASSTINCRCEG